MTKRKKMKRRKIYLVNILSVLVLFYLLYMKRIVKIRTCNVGDPYILKAEDGNGRVVLDKDISRYWNKPLRLWDYENEVLTFIHITKTGGTSFDQALHNSKLKNGCRLKCYAMDTRKISKSSKKCPGILGQFCGKHFDWSFVHKINEAGLKTAPIVMLRHPISRVISEYYFSKHTERNTGHKFLKQNISEFLTDLDSMMESNHLWHDGHGSAVWLTGIHIGTWWMTGWLPPEEILRREQLSTNWTYMLNVAIDNLHKCLWVGILEELDQSIEMLRFQTGLDLAVHHLKRNNVAKVRLTERQTNMLKALLPIDMYIYEYAKHLHDHRWQIYLCQQNNSLDISDFNFEMPKLPLTIDGCKSTRFHLDCPMLNINYSYTPSAESLNRTLRATLYK